MENTIQTPSITIDFHNSENGVYPYQIRIKNAIFETCETMPDYLAEALTRFAEEMNLGARLETLKSPVMRDYPKTYTAITKYREANPTHTLTCYMGETTAIGGGEACAEIIVEARDESGNTHTVYTFEETISNGTREDLGPAGEWEAADVIKEWLWATNPQTA